MSIGLFSTLAARTGMISPLRAIALGGSAPNIPVPGMTHLNPIVPAQTTPIVTMAPQLPPVQPFAGPSPIVSVAPRPMSMNFGASSFGPMPAGPVPGINTGPQTMGAIGGNGQPIGTQIGAPSWGDILKGAASGVLGGVINQRFGGGGANQGPTGPTGTSAAMPGGGVAAGQAGLGTDILKGIGVGVAVEGTEWLVNKFFGGGGGSGGMLPRGYHPNKALVRYSVAKANGHNVQDPRDEPRVRNAIVRNRSMNPLNPRALGRANTRIHSFSRIARKALHHLGYSVSRTRTRSSGSKKKRR